MQQQAFGRVARDDSLSFAQLTRALAAYCGPLPPDAAAPLAVRLHTLRPDLFPTAASAEESWRSGGLASLPSWREQASPYSFFLAADDSAASRLELLPRQINAHRSDQLPRALTRSLDATHCPAFDMLSATNVSLFCSPAGFQVFSQDGGFYMPSATSRPLSTAILDLIHVEIDRPVVLVQDIFHGTNFAHFLFDWTIRIMAFVDRKPITPRDCIFVMGGFPQRFQQIVLNALMSILALEEDNFFFPEGQMVLRSSAETVWFSDTCNASGHPAQMFRPESTEWMRRLARSVLPEPPVPTRRLYVSRADVGRRMVANEGALTPILEAYGFETVLLSQARVDEQITLMASATHIVSAHGMGLTHLAFHPGTPSLLELFNPEQGTDAYAFMAKALGFGYAALIGRPLEDQENFVVDVGTLARQLPDADGVTLTTRPDGLTAQRWFPGVQSLVAAPDSQISSSRDTPALRHIRDGTTPDSNVGWWELHDLQPGGLYVARCEILIPAESDVADIVLHFDGAAPTQTAPDLSQREIWQSLAVTGMCDPATKLAHLVLRMNGAEGCSVLTAGWSVTGSWATDQGDRSVATLQLRP